MKTKSTKKKTDKAKEPKRISYYRKPENLNIDQWQVALRKQFGQENEFQISNIGSHPFFSDFHVLNQLTKNTYKVSIRSADDSQNFCECLDFKTNRLGTCKHISAVFKHLDPKRGSKKAFKEGYTPPYSSVYLDYQNGRQVKFRIGTENTEKFEEITEKFFDKNLILKPAAFAVFELLLEECHHAHEDFRCYPDALDFVIEKRDKYRREIDFLREMPDEEEDKSLDNLLKVKMFPYQRKGVWFAAKAGRSLIADEMGLGKTIQALAVAELYKKELGINKVLIVCPTSLKYQWKTEIEKFTHGSTVNVIEGNLLKRKNQYENDESFYQVVSYHTIANDVNYLNKADVDLVILDEAQRIKNWKTKVSQQIKKLQTPYAIVLTGTPLENKLEELYSIMQFIDVFRLGPMYSFLNTYQITDEAGKVIGYQNLNEIKSLLSDTLIRRTKKEVLSQLPKRMDKNLFVPMTQEQMDIHNDFQDVVSRLVTKWRRYGFLKEPDRKRLILSLSQMRMVCDSTYILDQKTRKDTKIDELMSILDEFFENSDEKVVVFSQWERMTRLVAAELDAREVRYEYLHGGVESKNRKDLLTNFTNDPESRVFLSTDAGGVGLNLQAASLMINLDIPWNPAVLEQRIARIYRLGQERNVSIINLVSSGTIEHRMLDVLKFKGAMAEGVLDGGEDTIFLGDDKFKQFMNSIENLTETPTETDAVIDTPEEHESEVPVAEVPQEILVDKPDTAATFLGDDDVAPKEQTIIHKTQESENQIVSTNNITSPQELLQNGFNFFGQLAQTLSNPEATKNLVNSIVQKDEKTGQTYLKIPVESQDVVQNALSVLGNLFASFGKK
jgi:SNF2 family DNA or RNA helicase